jgi:hypothetical protein
MIAPENQPLSRVDKPRLIQAQWADLSWEDNALVSPAWHGDALRETAERRARGEESLLDWADAKAKLRAAVGAKRSAQ